ncbi:Translation initiation factor 3 family protein putative isoform 1 [Tripterygium wilfordii]|uniref:Translation initiation factor 3 family protein putative isoform 1 n=1 Tax=Tripterygium wilfordii TaxID=458696 RepID=A0A7J7E0D3_TRIWF|nr:translation initiation factor IF3-1, mitochondrial-like [Tripterygium wilfordii]KAF5752003.1 Translation initiation factor 3 family protein putative isoform 1 [Tripterygium wilfordii]
MAFWCRINQSKLKLFSHQLKRYLQISHASSLNYSTTCSTHYLLENPLSGILRKRTDFFSNVRFFAAPVQTKPKKEEKGTSGPRLNEQITAHIVRVVTDEEHHVVSRREALERARKLNLDLVEVQRNADPPVCKIMDFHKERYKQEVKEKERAKSKSQGTLKVGDCKVIRFYPKCELKDLKIKADMVKRLMERGYRVKCVAKPKGAEDQDLGELLSRLSAMIEDVSVVESGPRVEASQAYIVVRHVKFGPSKKGGGKKSKAATNASAGVQEGSTSATSAVSPDEEDESIADNETAWSVVDSNDDFESVFELSDDMNGASAYPADEMHSAALTASSSTTFNKSDIGHRRPVPNSKANTHPSFPPQPSLETVNRYARSESKNQFPPAKPTDNRIPATRDPYPRRQMPQETNLRPSVSEGRQPGGSSPFPDLKPSSKDVRRQEHSRPNASDTPRPSYGIFSTPNANAPRNQGQGRDARWNREGSSNDTATIPGTGGVVAKQNQRPVDDKAGQGRWGIFSREGSAATPDGHP